MGDMRVFTTMEIMIGVVDGISFQKKFDAISGYDELDIVKDENFEMKVGFQ